MTSIPDLSLNERRLIELIFANKEIARVDLAHYSGMTGASVTRLIAGLVEIGLLTEEAERNGAQGQPRRLLSLQADRFLSAGITFSVARMEVVIIDLVGAILASCTIDIETSTAKAVARSAQGAIESMLSVIRAPKDRLLGIGCSVPGNFGTMANIVKAHAFFPAFDDGEAEGAFKDTFEVPCYIENDGTAAALGEYVFGQRPEHCDPMFFIHIGHGVGGGAVVNGRPFRGLHGNACLPGALFSYDQPRPSGQDLLSCLAADGFVVKDFADLTSLPEEGQHVLSRWIDRAAEQLRFAVRAATGFFDPAIIVVGGRLPNELNHRLVDVMLAKPIEGPSRGLPVAPVEASRLGVQAGAIGAACIPLSSTLFSGAISDVGSSYLNGRRPTRAGGELRAGLRNARVAD